MSRSVTSVTLLFYGMALNLPADQSVRLFAKTYQILDPIGLYIA